MADAADLKSAGPCGPCEFESHPRYQGGSVNWQTNGLHLKTYISIIMQTENLIKGHFIELVVQAELVRYGFDISIPTYNSARYDFLIDTGTELLKIQVKKSISNSSTSFTFQTTSQNVRSKTQTGKRKYTSDEVDYFATAWEGRVYLVPIDETSNQKTIQFNDETYLASKVLQSYDRLSDDEIYNRARKNQGKNHCNDCGAEIQTDAPRCMICARKARRIVERPSREELKQLIRTQTFTSISLHFGVSDNAIRKWCDAENLPRKKTEINAISDERWEEI